MKVMTDDELLIRDIAPFGLRMPPDLKDRVKASAKLNKRSMNAEIVAVLEEKFPAPPRAPQVELIALIQDTDGITPTSILVDGAVTLCGLRAVALRAVADQHPHLSGKPIVALRYKVAGRA